MYLCMNLNRALWDPSSYQSASESQFLVCRKIFQPPRTFSEF